MNAVVTANLVGITGIARRLVQDGALDEAVARTAMVQATEAKVPLAQWIAEKKLVAPAQMAAANAVEFGMPLLDVSAFDPSQNALKLVSEELVQKHHVLPLFKRSERNESGETEYRGGGGPLAVSSCYDPHASHKAFLAAAWQNGFKADARFDFNEPSPKEPQESLSPE